MLLSIIASSNVFLNNIGLEVFLNLKSGCISDKGVRIMVINATFNYNSAISVLSVLLVEETGVLGENHRPAASH